MPPAKIKLVRRRCDARSRRAQGTSAPPGALNPPERIRRKPLEVEHAKNFVRGSSDRKRCRACPVRRPSSRLQRRDTVAEVAADTRHPAAARGRAAVCAPAARSFSGSPARARSRDRAARGYVNRGGGATGTPATSAAVDVLRLCAVRRRLRLRRRMRLLLPARRGDRQLLLVAALLRLRRRLTQLCGEPGDFLALPCRGSTSEPTLQVRRVSAAVEVLEEDLGCRLLVRHAARGQLVIAPGSRETLADGLPRRPQAGKQPVQAAGMRGASE